jgi:hypothetical protein
VLVLPGGQVSPAEQVVQLSAPAALYVPAPQVVHVATTVVGLYVPAGQSVQALQPPSMPSVMYVPTGHVVKQTLAPAMLYVPPPQRVHVPPMLGLDVPAGQSIQAAEFVISYVPAGQ